MIYKFNTKLTALRSAIVFHSPLIKKHENSAFSNHQNFKQTKVFIYDYFAAGKFFFLKKDPLGVRASPVWRSNQTVKIVSLRYGSTALVFGSLVASILY
jgi:hypothetical protein